MLLDRLIFNMVIPILGKDGLYIEIGPRRLAIIVTNSGTVYWRLYAPLVQDESQIDILFAFDFSKQKYNDISYDYEKTEFHYSVVIMGTMASQINSLTIIYLTVYSGADQGKHQSSASLAFVLGIHREPVISPHKWPVTRKIFPFDDVILMTSSCPHYAKMSVARTSWSILMYINIYDRQICKFVKSLQWQRCGTTVIVSILWMTFPSRSLLLRHLTSNRDWYSFIVL